jgi:hypothetical protein
MATRPRSAILGATVYFSQPAYTHSLAEIYMSCYGSGAVVEPVRNVWVRWMIERPPGRKEECTSLLIGEAILSRRRFWLCRPSLKRDTLSVALFCMWTAPSCSGRKTNPELGVFLVALERRSRPRWISAPESMEENYISYIFQPYNLMPCTQRHQQRRRIGKLEN